MKPFTQLAAALCSAPLACLAATFAGIEIPKPLPEKPVSDTFHGVTVVDPYRYFENVTDPAVKSWMKSNADATSSVLSKIPARDKMLARLKEIEAGSPGLVAAARKVGGRYFFLKRDPSDNQYRLVYRDTAAGPDRLVVDPEGLRKKTGTPHAILDFAASPDGKLVAYAIQAGGGEIGTLHVVDLASGKEVIAPIDRIRYGNVHWLDDSSGFFYSRLREGYDKLPPTEKFGDRTRHFLLLAKPDPNHKVFSPSRNADLKLPTYASGSVQQVPGTTHAANQVFHGVEKYRQLFVSDLESAKAGTARWREVVRLEDRVVDMAIGGGFVYVVTSRSSPRYEVLRFPLDGPGLSAAQVVVPASQSVIKDLSAAKDAVYVVRRDGATESLWRRAHAADAKLEKVALPVEGSVALMADTMSRSEGVLVTLAGWTRTSKPYEAAGMNAVELPFVMAGAFDAPSDIVSREVRYKSHDGVEVPLSIVARRDAKLDGSNPTLVYGYGAYGSTESPFFNPRIYSWVERGGVWAVAHVRGGGAFGEEWRLAGQKTTKPNTWKDAIAAGEWLVANGYATKERLGIYGGSAGGVFVGRAITERPDLFAAAVPLVGCLDALRMENGANGVANIPEFGTVKQESEFKGLLAMSTYHTIRDGTRYPAVMLVHGVNDIRVDVWQSLKAGARFASATSSGKPVLMRLEYDSGHGQGSTRAQVQERYADIWAFMLWQMGVPEFQP